MIGFHISLRNTFFNIYSFLNRHKPIISYKNNQFRKCSSMVFDLEGYTDTSIEVPRTLLSPKDHTHEHIGMWYTLNNEIAHRLYNIGGLTKKQIELNQIFQETAFMIRKPAVSVIDYIKQSNFAYPPNKFILYGRNGTGKTMSLAHLVHYFVEEQFVLIHVGVPARWLTNFKEILPSTSREDFYDHTADASLWLQQFKQQNEGLLNSLNLVTAESYQWTQRDVTEKGSPLLSIIDFGITRSKYASDCVYSLNTELKRLAQDGRIKVAVVIDGINAFFGPTSQFKKDDGTLLPTEKLTFFQAFLQFLPSDWRNGVIIGSIDTIMNPLDRRESYLPRYVLRKKGWDALDPFVPIEVSSYSDKELYSALNYYLDRKWLQHPAGRTKEGKEELSFMSGNNGLELINRVNAI